MGGGLRVIIVAGFKEARSLKTLKTRNINKERQLSLNEVKRSSLSLNRWND